MSNQPKDTSTPTKSSSTLGVAPTQTKASTPPNDSGCDTVLSVAARRDLETEFKMDGKNKEQQTTKESDRQDLEEAVPVKAEEEQKNESNQSSTLKKKAKCKKPEEHKSHQHKKRKSKKARKDDTVTGSESEDESDEDDSSSSSSSESLFKKLKKLHVKFKGKKQKQKRKNKIVESDSDSDSSEAEELDQSESSSSSDDEPKKSKTKLKSAKKAKDKKPKKGKKSKKPAVETEESEDDDESGDASLEGLSKKELQQQVALLRQMVTPSVKTKSESPVSKAPKIKKKSTKKDAHQYYKRVDQIWDSTTHNYKLKESTEEDTGEFAEYAFLVRRTFDWENKYRSTVVDIKSKLLRASLQEVMKDCKSVSLEALEPHLDPNTLFLYLEELRTYYKKSLKAKTNAEKKRKAKARLEKQRLHLKTLVAYIDQDYEETKKTLYPLIKAGNITFELLWALFKPNEIAVTSCYGAWEEPRCFKVDYANKYKSMTRGEWYCVEGRYMEYDGKAFGFGDFEVDVDEFKGPRKITSLATYPLKYHKDPAKVKKQILERAEKFVNMEGMQYKFHKGLAFMKKKRQVLKINVNGRVMVDPSTFRRINPNYPISIVKKKEDEDLFKLSDDSDSDSCSCGHDSDDESAAGDDEKLENKFDDDHKPKYMYKWSEDSKGKPRLLAVEVDEDGAPIQKRRLDKLAENPDLRQRAFTEEELLLTTPVVLGFAFSDKLWLEFTISGVNNIQYNENAFDSLVLPPNQKSIVRAQVESHKIHAAKTIDDVVQGKGKGLVAVLHGPPGTGKTLTAEGIAELLKCPLYMVSAGELGTDPGRLEHSLQQILDIAHSWGAILLLDEADVFLEKREVHDIHRNALVSLFLRLLEYFQGILFLTTNRVETFDDAFQSRIHIALRYGELTFKARKSIWSMFLELVKKVEGMEMSEFSDKDLDILSRNQLNGRQIKNLVRTAQALALNEKQKLTMEHVKRVIDVAESFNNDLRGGLGYIDAMRSYT